VATFMAVRTLTMLEGVDPALKTDVVRYLKQTRYAGRTAKAKYSTLPNIEEMSYVLEALSDLSALKVVDNNNVMAFIESLYIQENGGFGPEPGLGTTPPSTYHAIVCLSMLGKLKHAH